LAGARLLSRCRHDGTFLEMPLPWVQPIAPTWRKEPFDDADWVFDVKYDGFRALYYAEQRRCCFISRNGSVMRRFDALGDEMAVVLDVDDVILDGEVIVADETGRPQFYDLLRGRRAPVYIAFDIAWLNGVDLRSLPLHERRERLQGILSKDGVDLRSLPLHERRERLQGILSKELAIVCEALSVAGRGRELFELVCAHDLEGIVAKRLADRYDPRAKWHKIKNPDYSQEEGRAELFDRSSTQRPWKYLV
jgi:bifunctional non-homologous end joining protein LigD